jgi:hypothetical protein
MKRLPGFPRRAAPRRCLCVGAACPVFPVALRSRRAVGASLRLALTALRGRSRCTLPENLSLRIDRDQIGDGGAMAFNR